MTKIVYRAAVVAAAVAAMLPSVTLSAYESYTTLQAAVAVTNDTTISDLKPAASESHTTLQVSSVLRIKPMFVPFQLST